MILSEKGIEQVMRDCGHCVAYGCVEIEAAARAIAEKMAEGVVWQGEGWMLINDGCVDFDMPRFTYMTEGQLLCPAVDGQPVTMMIVVTKGSLDFQDIPKGYDASLGEEE